MLAKLRGELRSGAAEDAEKTAHQLGGTSATCGMAGIIAPLRELEHSGKASRWSESEPLILEAERQLARIHAQLSTLPDFQVPTRA